MCNVVGAPLRICTLQLGGCLVGAMGGERRIVRRLAAEFVARRQSGQRWRGEQRRGGQGAAAGGCGRCARAAHGQARAESEAAASALKDANARTGMQRWPRHVPVHVLHELVAVLHELVV
jgi:hypothetical protein